MIDKSNKKFWYKFAKLYAPFMKKDKGVYDKVCEYIRPYLNKDLEVLELACGSGQLSFNLSKYTDEKFDCVVIANALHIMPKLDEAMKEIYRVLKPHGTLFAPTFLWKEGKQRKMIKSLMSILGFKMYQEWDKKEFEDFIKEYGFSVVEMKLVYGGFAPIGVMIAQKAA